MEKEKLCQKSLKQNTLKIYVTRSGLTILVKFGGNHPTHKYTKFNTSRAISVQKLSKRNIQMIGTNHLCKFRRNPQTSIRSCADKFKY